MRGSRILSGLVVVGGGVQRLFSLFGKEGIQGLFAVNLRWEFKKFEFSRGEEGGGVRNPLTSSVELRTCWYYKCQSTRRKRKCCIASWYFFDRSWEFSASFWHTISWEISIYNKKRTYEITALPQSRRELALARGVNKNTVNEKYLQCCQTLKTYNI